MDVILINAYLLKINAVTLFNFFTYLIQGLLAVRTTENGLPIFNGGYKMIMYLIRIMFSCPDRSHTLIISYKVTAQQADAE